jgi:serine phosphatase RsbU (regulator of sigma subunit)
MILLGAKISGDIYTQEELDILLAVAGQTAVAVENARLYLKELQQQRAEEELKIARRIQQDLLPKDPPQVKGLEIAGCSLPATEVGGDYFDYILQDHRRLIVFVGDVSGKGMPAALYMSKVQGMVQMAGSLYHSPKDILKEVNRRIIHGIDKNSFITMLSVLFDLKKKQAIIARAGHTPLFLKKSNQKEAEVILPKGLGLGITSGEDFDRKIEEVTIPMQSKDFYVLFSDGLTEAMNPKQELFGEERVMDLLNQNHHLASQAFRDLLVSHAGKFRENEEQNDDITVVIVKVK